MIRSLKELFLPPSEVLFTYRQRKDGVEIQEVPTAFPPQIVLGARPCDAAGIEILDRVMGWDYRDELWFGRRQATTLVSLACPGGDASCFCSALGLGPDSSRGADALLVPVASGYLVQIVTPKGEALLAGRGRPADAGCLAEADALRAAARARVEKNLAAVPAGMADWLARSFDAPVWKTMALRCHGCGACASVCSTCHCFDIVDEHDDCSGGARRRNWDSCQAARFTIHASGHNPRRSQTERFRQRVMHKLSIYPRRFGETLCTGCGRCARACPAGMNLPEIVGQLAQLAGAEP